MSRFLSWEVGITALGLRRRTGVGEDGGSVGPVEEEIQENTDAGRCVACSGKVVNTMGRHDV